VPLLGNGFGNYFLFPIGFFVGIYLPNDAFSGFLSDSVCSYFKTPKPPNMIF
jgi:hypothetical protein